MVDSGAVSCWCLAVLVVITACLSHCDQVTGSLWRNVTNNNTTLDRQLQGLHNFHYEKKDFQLGCRELRSKRYISDGLCTTSRPISEVVCANWCVVHRPGPGSQSQQRDIPWHSVTPKRKPQHRNATNGAQVEKWRCFEGESRKRRVKLLCKDGTIRAYNVKVVKSCKCSKKLEGSKKGRQNKKSAKIRQNS